MCVEGTQFQYEFQSAPKLRKLLLDTLLYVLKNSSWVEPLSLTSFFIALASGGLSALLGRLTDSSKEGG